MTRPTISQPAGRFPRAAFTSDQVQEDVVTYLNAAQASLDVLDAEIIAGTGSSFINVKQSPYNAMGDGTTDDTVAIQAAHNAAVTAGLSLYFPKGTYLLTNQGGSPARCISIAPSTTDTHWLGGPGSLIKVDTRTSHGIYVGTGSTKLTFEKMSFSGWTGAGADDDTINIDAALYFAGGVGDVLIDQCFFDHIQPAFFQSDDESARLIFSRNTSTNQPLALNPPGYSVITDNFFHDDTVITTRSHSIYVFGRAEHLIITGNSFRNQGDAVIQVRANDAKRLQKRCWQICDNYFENSFFYGLFLSSETSAINIGTFIITNNVFKNVVGPIQMLGLQDAIVSNNVIEYDYQYNASRAGFGIALGAAFSGSVCIPRGVHIVNNRIVNRHPFYGVVTIAAPPAPGDTVVVGAQTYTWRTAQAISGEVTIASAVDDCAANLSREINGRGLTTRNLIIRDLTDTWYTQNTGEGLMWVASDRTFTFSATGTAISVGSVINNGTAMSPAISVNTSIGVLVENNSIEGVWDSGSQIQINHCVEPTIRNNIIFQVGGSGMVCHHNARAVYDGNRLTWDHTRASGNSPDHILQCYDAFPVIKNQGLLVEQNPMLPWLQGQSGVVGVGDGKALAYFFYGEEQSTSDEAARPFHWTDGDVMSIRDGVNVARFVFKRSGPDGITEFNSYATLMALINTQSGGIWTATNPVNTYFGSDSLADGYMEIKYATGGTGGNSSFFSIQTISRTCSVILYDTFNQLEAKSYFAGGASAPTKTVVFTPLASLTAPLFVQGVDAASQALNPIAYQADTIPGVCYVITHSDATSTPTAKFFFSVS